MTDDKTDIIWNSLRSKLVKMRVEEWDMDIDLDKLLQIDYSNIFGEIITIPVLENQIGRLFAEVNNYYKEQSIHLQVKEAEVRKLFRGGQIGEGQKKPTVQEVEDHLTLDPVIKNLRLRLLRIEKDMKFLEVLYDAVKSKAFKLNNLSRSINPEGFDRDLIEGRVNNVLIELKKKRFSGE